MTEQNDQEHSEWDIDNLPNRLTFFRMFLIPVIIFCLYLSLLDLEWIKSWKSTLGWVAGWTFTIASITDFLDGYIARKRNIITNFGSFLDPVADKFLVVSSLLLLQALGRIPVLIVIILVLREFYITSLRLLAKEKNLQVPVGKMGKWKTAIQMIGIPLLMAYEHPFGIPFPLLGNIAIYIASILSLYSALEYSLGLIKKIKAIKNSK